MSFVQIYIELPAYSHSFIIHVQSNASIRDLKQEIFKSCQGGPKVDGQRLICRGRVLANEENIEQVWKSTEEVRTIHLAVHPSAWSSEPPLVSSPQTETPLSATLPLSTPHSPENPSPPSVSDPRPRGQTSSTLEFIANRHQAALTALTENRIVPLMSQALLNSSRHLAILTIRRNGWNWPTILDEPYPEPSEGGVKYERAVVDGESYLSLATPDATPTPIQLHALKVLTTTFPLLYLSPPRAAVVPPVQTPVPAHLNAVLQQLGLHRGAAGNPPAIGPHANLFQRRPPPLARGVSLIPLMLALVMLLFRTLVLLYFIAPTRKPVIGILITAWAAYEGYHAIQGALRAVARADNRQGEGGQPAAEPPAPQGQEAARERGAQRPRPTPTNADNGAESVLNTMGNLNLNTEERALDVAEGASPVPEPGLVRKATTFLSLFMVTLHPAVWNHRRTALSRREGRMRTEAHGREEQPDEPSDGNEDLAQREQRERRTRVREELITQHRRRPRWVQNYIERARNGDWVDDAD